MGYKIKQQVLWKNIDNEVVIVDPDTDNYSCLNATARDVWELLGKGNPVNEIVSELCARYDAPEECIREDVQSLIEDLLVAGLIAKK